jgi:predicted RNA polymerase sigma factor
MLLTDARRHARTGPQGEPVPIHEQDRSLWNRELIEEGLALLSGALRQGSVGPYQLQAAIAAVHDEARCASETDWPQILALYDLLERISGSPIVQLNRAVAVAMVRSPQEALRLLDDLAGC